MGDHPDRKPNHLARLARAVAEGEDVDWGAEAEHAAANQGIVHQLAALARIQHAMAPGASAEISTRWGPLLVFERIGQGSFGTVYRARDPRLERDVALKLIPTAGPVRADEVIEEGRLLAKVHHPSVLAVFGAEEIGGEIGIWTELVRGRTLADLVRREGPLPWRRAVRVVADVCAAVAAVHAGGLVHRDIKAQNVMLTVDGRVVLMDFGAGFDTAADPATDTLGHTPGTPLYTAPEVWAGESPSAASDIYAIGVLFFFLLTARFPVEARSAAELAAFVRAGTRPVWDRIRPSLPDGCAEIIHRAVAVVPGSRYQTAGAFAADLLECLERQQGAGSSRRMVTGLHAGLIVVAAALLFTTFPRRSSEASSEPTSTKLDFLSNMTFVPSPDGAFIPYGRSGRLAEWQISTGRSEFLPWRPPTPGAILTAVASHDGRRIAIARQTEDAVHELDVVGRADESASVVAGSTGDDQIVPIQWSRDDRSLLSWIVHKNRQALLALVDPSTGRTHIVREFAVKPMGAALSTDGRYVAFDQPPESDQGPRDVFVASVDGGPATVVAPHPADDTRPFWTPDGRGIAFTSTRSGSTGEWFVPARNGVATEEPRLIARLPAGAAPFALTDDGSMFYSVRTNDIDVYTRPLDLHGIATGPAARVDPSITGGRSLPAWSADSRYLSYLSTDAAGNDVFNVLEWRSRAPRSMPLPLARHWDQVSWAPDGSCVLFAGIDPRNRRGFFCVDVQTGSPNPVWLMPGSGDERLPPLAFFGMDAFIYFDNRRGIVWRNRTSGSERLLIPMDDPVHPTGAFRVSPDGRTVAFNAALGNQPHQTHALAVKPSSGPARVLIETPPGQSTLLQGWSPDSQEVLFTRFIPGRDPSKITYRLHAVDVASGVERDLHVAIPGFTWGHDLAIRPDGAMIAYAHFTNVALAEIWRMQHLLPQR